MRVGKVDLDVRYSCMLNIPAYTNRSERCYDDGDDDKDNDNDDDDDDDDDDDKKQEEEEKEKKEEGE